MAKLLCPAAAGIHTYRGMLMLCSLWFVRCIPTHKAMHVGLQQHPRHHGMASVSRDQGASSCTAAAVLVRHAVRAHCHPLVGSRGGRTCSFVQLGGARCATATAVARHTSLSIQARQAYCRHCMRMPLFTYTRGPVRVGLTASERASSGHHRILCHGPFMMTMMSMMLLLLLMVYDASNDVDGQAQG